MHFSDSIIKYLLKYNNFKPSKLHFNIIKAKEKLINAFSSEISKFCLNMLKHKNFSFLKTLKQ